MSPAIKSAINLMADRTEKTTILVGICFNNSRVDYYFNGRLDLGMRLIYGKCAEWEPEYLFTVIP